MNFLTPMRDNFYGKTILFVRFKKFIYKKLDSNHKARCEYWI